MEFDKGDVIYYKVKMKKLLDEAAENNIKVAVEDLFGLNHIFFRNDIEVAGCAIKTETSLHPKPPKAGSAFR